MTKYLTMTRMIAKSLIEWDEVYLTASGRILTGAEWDAVRPKTTDSLVGSCWTTRLHLEIELDN
jgi:hypothetical protein